MYTYIPLSDHPIGGKRKLRGMVISVAPSYDALCRFYRQARKIISLLLCTFLPGFSYLIIYLRKATLDSNRIFLAEAILLLFQHQLH